MQKKNFLVFVFLMLGFYGLSQRKPTIKGNRNVVEIQEELPNFRAIQLMDDLDVSIESASSTGYALTADDNLIDVLKFNVENEVLTISSYYKIKAKKKLEITIQYDVLDAINLFDGSLTAIGELNNVDALHITCQGFSRMELHGNAPYINLEMDGNSSGNFNIESDSLNIVANNRSNVAVYYVGETMSVNLQRNAKANVDGTVEQLAINLSGTSQLTATNLQASKVSAVVRNAPTLSVFAIDSLVLSSKGEARTFLSGDPKIKILEFLDTSQLIKQK